MDHTKSVESDGYPVKSDSSWLEPLMLKTQEAQAILPSDIPSVLSELLTEEFGATRVTPKRLTEIADSILDLLAGAQDDQGGSDENPSD